MDRPHDTKKKYPLLVVGDLPFLGQEKPATSLREFTPEQWQDSFLCLSAASKNLRTLVEEAHQLGIPSDQLVLCTDALTFSPPAEAIVIEFHPDENAEDFRHRLYQKIDSHRHLKFAHEWAKAETSPAAFHEQARLAHALALLHDLSISAHARAIRGALKEISISEPWPAQSAPEELIAYCAALMLARGDCPANFREAFRECSAQLPFRVRNELKTQAEKILETLWGGKHAA